jgi:hypothetical protein
MKKINIFNCSLIIILCSINVGYAASSLQYTIYNDTDETLYLQPIGDFSCATFDGDTEIGPASYITININSYSYAGCPLTDKIAGSFTYHYGDVNSNNYCTFTFHGDYDEYNLWDDGIKANGNIDSNSNGSVHGCNNDAQNSDGDGKTTVHISLIK